MTGISYPVFVFSFNPLASATVFEFQYSFWVLEKENNGNEVENEEKWLAMFWDVVFTLIVFSFLVSLEIIVIEQKLLVQMSWVHINRASPPPTPATHTHTQAFKRQEILCQNLLNLFLPFIGSF